jgi:NDP-sugar pyrophosphorylase family protein
VDQFFISVNYLADVIKTYFKNGADRDVNIQYLEEQKPLGTIGAVALCENFQHEDVLVMNSDLLTTIDFEDFYSTYKKEDADLIIACIPYQVSLPYGVIETNGSRVVQVKEKPTYTYYSNAGIYLFKKSIVNWIPKGDFFNATDLIESLITANYKVVNYSLLNYWLDIGKPDDFVKAQEDIKHLKL